MKRRKVQTVVIFTVLLVSTAAGTLAFGLLFDSSAPFERAFAARHGAEVTAASKATPARLAATTGLAGVTAAAGPFPPTTVICCVGKEKPDWPGGGASMVAVTVVWGNGPAAAVTPARPVVAASWAGVALLAAVTSAPCRAANARSNGALESKSKPNASVPAAVDTSSTVKITTVCALRRVTPPGTARGTGAALIAALPHPRRWRSFQQSCDQSSHSSRTVEVSGIRQPQP